VAGVALAAFAGFVAAIGLCRQLRGGWKVYLLHSGVTLATGTGRTALTWAAIGQVWPQEVTRTRGIRWSSSSLAWWPPTRTRSRSDG
jgi:hypothetical protein